MNEITPQTGNVIIQALQISKIFFTLYFPPFDFATPIIDIVLACVVLTGSPR